MKKIVVQQMAALMTAAFGLIAALAWNDAILSLFKPGAPLFFLAAGGVWVYAVLVTILAVLATIWISKVSEKTK